MDATDGARVELVAFAGSDASGIVRMREGEDSVVFQIDLARISAGVHRGFLRRGAACDAIGAAVVELPPVTADANGSGSASGSIARWSAEEGRLVITYHDAGGTPGRVVLCAPLAG